METARQTNRWFYHAESLLKEADQQRSGASVGPLPDALEEGAAALIERGIASLIAEFIKPSEHVGTDWRQFLSRYYSEGGDLHRLYSALLTPQGELHVLDSRLGRLLRLSTAQPVNSGMIQSDVNAVPLQALLKHLKALTSELRQGAEEW
ncbi:hypothetical protein LMG33818_000336 [Halomonadaceae bacterium LMG 33818]|uniref:DUF6586 family protein n=1 Tax=Cernens ardua TaxID=3402176 RepID=UPI003EDC60D4